MTVPAIDQKAIAEAVRILDAGGLVAMPTETVYGLAADADNEEAVLNTYRAKGRPNFLHICLLCSVCIPVCVGKKFLHCNGIVYFWTRIHLIYR